MKIAALIVHYEVEELTDTAVDCVRQQALRPDVFVVDAGSTKAYTNRHATIFRLPESPGLAGAFNFGMKMINHEYPLVWHYTNDVTAPQGTLRLLVNAMKQYDDLAAIQPCMPSSHSHLKPKEDALRGKPSALAPAPFLEWAAVLMSTVAWVDVGILDEGFNFFSMDIDWSHRAIKKSWWLAVHYGAVCDHILRGTHNKTNFNIEAQGAKEHEYGTKKYGRKDWQRYLKGEVE